VFVPSPLLKGIYCFHFELWRKFVYPFVHSKDLCRYTTCHVHPPPIEILYDRNNKRTTLALFFLSYFLFKKIKNKKNF
jgi:hypothetical protein